MTAYPRTSFTAGNIFAETAGLVRHNSVLCCVGALLMFAAKAGTDFGVRQGLPGDPRSAALFGLINIPVLAIIHYFVIARLMQAEQLTDRGWSAGGLLRFFAAHVLASLGMIFGIILLIVPGIIAAIRWAVYANFVIGRALAPISAIKASWEATRGHGGTIFLALFLLGMASLPGILVARGGFGTHAEASTATVVIGNFYTAVLGMGGLCVTTSIYALLVGSDHGRLSELFA